MWYVFGKQLHACAIVIEQLCHNVQGNLVTHDLPRELWPAF